jgi:hypothetical protein
METPSFRAGFLTSQMMQSITSTPEAYAELIRTDSRRWGKIIADAKLSLE